MIRISNSNGIPWLRFLFPIELDGDDTERASDELDPGPDLGPPFRIKTSGSDGTASVQLSLGKVKTSRRVVYNSGLNQASVTRWKGENASQGFESRSSIAVHSVLDSLPRLPQPILPRMKGAK